MNLKNLLIKIREGKNSNLGRSLSSEKKCQERDLNPRYLDLQSSAFLPTVETFQLVPGYATLAK